MSDCNSLSYRIDFNVKTGNDENGFKNQQKQIKNIRLFLLIHEAMKRFVLRMLLKNQD